MRPMRVGSEVEDPQCGRLLVEIEEQSPIALRVPDRACADEGSRTTHWNREGSPSSLRAELENPRIVFLTPEDEHPVAHRVIKRNVPQARTRRGQLLPLAKWGRICRSRAPKNEKREQNTK